MTDHAEGTFTVDDFSPLPDVPELPVRATMATGIATMLKSYAGGVAGRSSTIFVSAGHPDSGAATYLALESFEGSLVGAAGSFTFVHAASTHGSDRFGDFFTIVEGSGGGALASITGTGGMAVDPDGTHRMWFDYGLSP